jgi:hypothetical protein
MITHFAGLDVWLRKMTAICVVDNTVSLKRPTASWGYNYTWQRKRYAVKGGVRLRLGP